MSIKGKVWKYGDDVNTDVIFPGKYTYTITDPKEMALHALEDLDSKLKRKILLSPEGILAVAVLENKPQPVLNMLEWE